MKPSDQLHALIQALDKNEKRYCMLHFQAPTRKNGQVMVALFSAISKQPSYDEAQIKREFATEPWLPRLSAEKGNLYKAITEALQAYQSPSAVETIQSKMQVAEILRGKGLYDQAAKQLRQAETLAQEHEMPTSMLHVQNALRHLIKEQVQKGRKEQLLASWQKSTKALAILRQETELEELYDRFFLLGRQEFVLRGKEGRKELEKWLQSPHMQPDAEPLSLQARIYQNLVWAIHHQLLGEFQQAHLRFLKNKLIWEEDREALARNPLRYLTTLANYLHSCCLIGEYKAIPPTLRQMDDLELQNWNQIAERFQNRNYYQLLYLLNQFDLDLALAQIPYTVEGLATYADKVNGARMLGFFYNFSIAYFLAEDFRNAKRWFQRILEGSESENRHDIRQMARIMVIICHFELQDHELMDALFQSASRHLRRRDRLHQVESGIFRHLRAIVATDSASDQKHKMQAFLDWLQPLLHHKEGQVPPAILEIVFWLKSRLANVKIVDIAKQSIGPQTPPNH